MLLSTSALPPPPPLMRTEPSQPRTKQSWKAMRMRPAPRPGLTLVAFLTASLMMYSALGHERL